MVQFAKLGTDGGRWEGRAAAVPRARTPMEVKIDIHLLPALLFAQFINPYGAKQCFLVF